MARLEKISNTCWKQPFQDRKSDFQLWSTHSEVAEHCEFKDGEKRLLQIHFEKHHELDVIDWFPITSGKEIYFPKEYQTIIKDVITQNPDSFFLVRILDREQEEDTESPQITSGITTIKTRIGQSKFRQDLIDYWRGCSVTGVTLKEILRASHIKPWADSNDSERVDRYNGLLLNPMLDTLLDKGFITFDDSGQIVISSEIIDIHIDLGISESSRLIKIEEQHKKYLKYHRDNIFRS